MSFLFRRPFFLVFWDVCRLQSFSFLRWWQLKDFLFSSRTLGNWFPFWRAYFSNGLVQPPTSFQECFIKFLWIFCVFCRTFLRQAFSEERMRCVYWMFEEMLPGIGAGGCVFKNAAYVTTLEMGEQVTSHCRGRNESRTLEGSKNSRKVHRSSYKRWLEPLEVSGVIYPQLPRV